MKEIVISRDIAIDIYRSMAVLLVLFFHLKISFFSFGFIGVDVFIFISGFLMCKWIDKSPIDYLSSRSKRIFPEVLILVLVTFILGFAFQMPSDYIFSLSHIYLLFPGLLSLYFSENIGYFGGVSELTTTLNLWSLSVELLCYYTFAFFLLIKLKRLYIFFFCIFLLTICILDVSISRFDYYSIAPRLELFWAGVIFARFLATKRLLFLLLFFSLGLIYFLYLYLFNQLPFQAVSVGKYPFKILYMALPLSLAFIYFPLRKISNLFLRGLFFLIADRSYAIYLSHWPVISFYKIITGNTYLNNTEILILIFLILGSTELLFRSSNKLRSYV